MPKLRRASEYKGKIYLLKNGGDFAGFAGSLALAMGQIDQFYPTSPTSIAFGDAATVDTPRIVSFLPVVLPLALESVQLLVIAFINCILIRGSIKASKSADAWALIKLML